MRVGYQPAHDIQDLTIQKLIDSLNKKGIDSLPLARTSQIKTIEKSLQKFHDLVATSDHNLKIKDIELQ